MHIKYTYKVYTILYSYNCVMNECIEFKIFDCSLKEIIVKRNNLNVDDQS